MNKQPVFCFINLGCAKNEVDAELLLAHLVKAGFLFAPEPEDADFCLVNTCGFIHDAREEAAEVLEEVRLIKMERPAFLIIALGCLVERAGDDSSLKGFLKNADYHVGFAQYPQLPTLCKTWLKGDLTICDKAVGYVGRQLPDAYVKFLNAPRVRIGSEASAYLKIAEGCSNHCAYCSIPRIRGDLVSRNMDDILHEAQMLLNAGVRELNMISQDTAGYGMDRYSERKLVPLLEKLLDVIGNNWLRILYVHPRHLDEALLDIIKCHPQLCPYLDLPLQHISDRMLKLMGRHIGRDATLRKLELIKNHLPEGGLRTTFLVGHPGETDADFEEIKDLVQQGIFNHMGVFLYSSEPGTRAAQMPDDIPAQVKQERHDELMELQQDVSRRLLRKRIGQKADVLIEQAGYDENQFMLIGRSQLEAPEVDGEILIPMAENAAVKPGQILPVEFTDASDYDLEARWIDA